MNLSDVPSDDGRRNAFGCGDVDIAVIHDNAGFPSLPVRAPIYSTKPRLVALVLCRILRVFGLGYASQVRWPVISTIAVDMVDELNRPFAIDYGPDNAMREELLVAYRPPLIPR